MKLKTPEEMAEEAVARLAFCGSFCMTDVAKAVRADRAHIAEALEAEGYKAIDIPSAVALRNFAAKLRGAT